MKPEIKYSLQKSLKGWHPKITIGKQSFLLQAQESELEANWFLERFKEAIKTVTNETTT
jgi:hypothetical protein